jgi:ABC-type multidrug transport system fused ATPase/permease subunit
MAVDVQRFQEITTFVMMIWSAPLQMILALLFLYNLLGWCVLVGLVLLVALIPLNMWLSSMARKCQVWKDSIKISLCFQTEQMECKDKRLRILSEVMNGIKMIKLYGWEQHMHERIQEQRQREVKILRRLAFLNVAISFSWTCAPFLVAVSTFGTYVLMDPVNNILTPHVTFVAISLFNILRFPMAVCVLVVQQIVQLMVSNARMKEFLAAEELPLAQINQRSEGGNYNV